MTLEEAAQKLNMDLARSLDLVLNNRSLLIHLLRAYCNDTCLADASLALAQKDYIRAAEQVHSMKGAGASLGLEQLADVCKEMVDAVYEKRYEQAEKRFAKVEQEFKIVRNIVEELD